MNKKKLIEAFEKHNPRTPMTEDETKIMMTLMMSKDIQFSTPIDELDKESEIYKHFKSLIDSFQGQVFLKRLQTFTSLKMTLGAFVPNIMVIGSSGGSSVNPMDAVGLNMLMDVQAKMNSNTNIPKK